MDKLDFRRKLAQKLSITRLDYYMKLLKELYGAKASVSDPDAFKDKIKLKERAQRQVVRRQNSKMSFSTNTFSKSIT